jgi:hypothetical protein
MQRLGGLPLAFWSRWLGPLLARELLRLARGSVLRLALIAAPTFVFFSLLSENPATDGEMSIQRRADSAASVANQAFVLSGVVVAFALPVWICPTIVRERRTGGLDLLLTTQVTTREILLGLAGAAGAVSACIVASLAPVIAMMALFGGVSAADIFAAAFLLLMEVLCLTGASLHAAAIEPTPIRATLRGAFQGLASFGVLGAICGPLVFSTLNKETYFVGLFTAVGFSVLAVSLFRYWTKQAADSLSANEEAVMVAKLTRSPEVEPPNLDARRSAMWSPLKLRLDDSDPTAYQIRAIWALYFLCCMPFCWIIRSGEGYGISRLVYFLWLVIQPFVVVAAATNPLLGRRPGFFDDLLTTNIDEREIVNGVLRIIQPALIRLLAAPVGLSVIWFALNPAGISVALLLGFSWTLEIVVVGTVLSLGDSRLGSRMMGLVVFALLVSVGPYAAAAYVSPPVHYMLFAAAPLALLAILYLCSPGRRSSLMACLLLHFTMACLAGWAGAKLITVANRNPLHLLSPAGWLSIALTEERKQGERWHALAALPFAVGLFLVVVGLWRWAGGNFDALAGRTRRRWRAPRPQAV